MKRLVLMLGLMIGMSCVGIRASDAGDISWGDDYGDIGSGLDWGMTE